KKASPPYETTKYLDNWGPRNSSRLEVTNQVYLDYTGGGLYGESQLRDHLALLQANVFGNPHSNNPTSLATTEVVERSRAAVLRYFNASPEEYVAIFTANASGALKLVGESYPFQPGSRYLLTFDNHNSVNGLREFARAKGARVTYAPLVPPELRLDRARLAAELAEVPTGVANLFAFPAQSNFSGVQHPLELIAEARAFGWDVLVDCAAFAPSNRLDLSRWQPDFVPISFYKMFGYPTGVGCLIARKVALAKLRRPWFAGGTVILASVQAMKHHLAENEAGFEDGTIDYLNIPAVEIGLKHLTAVNIDLIHERVRCLTGWLLDQLLALRHSNGKPLVRIYGPVETHMRGGTITINLYDPNGNLIDYRRVEELAGEANISLRTGCFCNPGAGELAEGLTAADMAAGFEAGRRMAFPLFLSLIQHQQGKSAGAIRISVGMVSNFADVFRFRAFARSFLDQSSESLGEVSFDIETCRVIRDGS
nr:aminotransferase class V-fold PLP-dependent enzyme [Anaerolineae bacterium]